MRIFRLFCTLLILCATVEFAFAGACSDFANAIALEGKNNGQAYEILEELRKSNGPCSDLASFEILKSLYKSEDYSAIVIEGKEHLSRFSHSTIDPEARLIVAGAMNETGDYDSALKLVEYYFNEYGEYVEPARALYERGRALSGLGKYEDAQEAFGQAVAYFGYQKWAREASLEAKALHSAGKASRKYPSRDAFRAKIDDYVEKRHFITCKRLCDAYTRFYPRDGWEMRLQGVDCLLARRKRSDARKELAQIEKVIPNSRKAKAALDLRFARAERGRGFRGKPKTNYWKILSDYPGTPGALEARYYIGYTHYDDYRFEQAADHLEKFLAKSKKPKHRDEALWMAGFSRFLEGQHGKAVDHFTAVINEFPEHNDLDRAYYWRGRAYDLSGYKDKAKSDYQWLVTRYKGTYYGLAAQIHLEVFGEPNFIAHERFVESFPWDFLLPIRPLPRLARDWAQENGGGPVLDEGARNALETFAQAGDPKIQQQCANFLALYDAGQVALAYDEAMHLYEKRIEVPYAGYAAGIMFSLCRYNLKAIFAANATARLIREGQLFDPHRVNARRQFPLLYFDLIAKTSKSYEIDPYLIIALVKQESAFQVEATSWVRAAGLFQVMPATGRWIARKRGIKGFSTKDLYDPETSADFGIWYFNRLLLNNDGDVPKSLAGYNAGGLRADRWWGANPGRRYDEMIELIGFHETRNYVKIILRNWEMYQRLYADPFNQDLNRDSVFLLLLKQVPKPMEKPTLDD